MAARLRRRWHAGWLLLAMVLILTTGSSPPSPAEPGAESMVPFQTPTAPGPTEPRVLVARVYFADRADRDRLASVLDAVETATTAGYITALISPAQYAALLQSGYRVEIDQARTDLVNAPAAGLPEQAEGIPGYVCYRTVDETYADLAALAASHPQLAAWIDIGDSWEKVTSGGAAGHDLYALVITSQARPGPKPVFFLMAAIHAREYATAELATRFAEYLVNGYGTDPDVTWLLDHYEVHVLPQANPDGRQVAETGLYHRKNTNSTAGSCGSTIFNHHGVDLNRNSSFHWGAVGVSADPCAQTYPGTGPASEPETGAIQAYVSSIFPDQRGPLLTDPAPAGASGIFISLHSYGQLVLFPWGDTNDPAPNDAALQTLGRKFGYLNGYSVCQPGQCLYATSGTTDDWAYAELGVAAYTFEVGTNFFESCAYFEDTLLPANLPALRYAMQSARNPYQAPAGPDTLGVTAALTTVVAGQAFTLTATADDTRSDSHGYGADPVQPIAAARLTVDQPSWITGTAALPLQAVDGAFDTSVEDLQAVVSTAGWAPGRHLLLVESQDAAGNWGVPSAVFVWVSELLPLAALTPDVSLAFGAPGGAVTHTLWLTNTSALTNTYAVSATGGAWPLGAPAMLGPLAPGAGLAITAVVSVPPGASLGDYDQAVLSVTPQSPPGQALTATLVSVVPADYGLLALPAASDLAGRPGATVTHTFRLFNLGALTDTYTLTVDGQTWTITAPDSAGPLGPGQGLSLELGAAIPASVTGGAQDAATLTLTSAGDPAQSASVVLRTIALWHKRYLPMLLD